MKIKVIAGILALVLLCGTVLAANGGSAPGVTEEMQQASYWCGQDRNSERVLMTAEEIRALNRRYVDGAGTMVFDLSELKQQFDADAQRESLANVEIPQRELYIKEEKLDNRQYFTEIARAIQTTGFTGREHENLYAIATSVADMKAIPTEDCIGYSADDPDDEYQTTALLPGEPFLIRQKCEINGKTFYWGYCNNLNGWISAEQLGLCADRAQWLQAWQTEPSDKDILVVTQNKIVLECSFTTTYSSEMLLPMGTVLKLVPREEIPRNLAQRGTWYNHVVYLPVRQADGSFARLPGLISTHYNVSVGYLPMTGANVLKLAFSCLGDTYGWGNMLHATDCSGMVRNVYRCFGLTLPRNTTWQQSLPETVISMGKMTDEEKLQVLSGLPLGTALYFPGHTFMLCGFRDGMAYGISNLGNVLEGGKDSENLSVYSVSVTPLSILRRNGHSWLEDMDAAVLLPSLPNLATCAVETNRTKDKTTVTVKDGDKCLTEGVDYTVSFHEKAVCVLGAGSYLGGKTVTTPAFYDVSAENKAYAAIQWAAEKKIIYGRDGERFDAEAVCTRGELAAMVFRAFGSEEILPAASCGDIFREDYYAAAVDWALAKGVILPASEGVFAPSAPCTAGVAAAAVTRGAKRTEELPVQDSDRVLTRGEVAELLYSVMQ